MNEDLNSQAGAKTMWGYLFRLATKHNAKRVTVIDTERYTGPHGCGIRFPIATQAEKHPMAMNQRIKNRILIF